MINVVKKIKHVLRIRKNKAYLFYFNHYYKAEKIIKKSILMESTHGRTFNGHLFYIAKDLEKRFPDYSLYIVSRDPQVTELYLAQHELKHAKVVKHLSRYYCKLLASCEYLINDTTFWPFFNKKEGQKYIIIWHGTPLKTLGKDMENLVDVANVQRNFYMADYLLTSNDYTQNILIQSHGLNGIYQGDLVEGPSPRNSILFDNAMRLKIRQECGLNHKRVFLYMPTWRGKVGKVNNNNTKLADDLHAISESLTSQDVFFVKLHPFQSDIDLSDLPKIHKIPEKYELYQFLTAVDMLITDYSSIMYDFMNTGREILIYAYDKDEYYESRGTYEDIEKYPFPIAYDIEQLLILMSKKEIQNYSSLRKRFCERDTVDGTKIISNFLFRHQANKKIKESHIYNGKETVAILSGGFWDNGITTALLNTLENIDTSKRNYLLFCGRNKLKSKYYFRVRHLPKNVLFYPVPGQINGNIFERFINRRYVLNENFRGWFIERVIKRMYKREFKRIFGDVKIDWFIHYTGFERKYAELLRHINAKTMIFVHTDMFREYEIKKNYSRKIIYRAYKDADCIAIVNKFLVDEFIQRLPFTRDKIHIMNNFLGEARVQKLAAENPLQTLVETELEYAPAIDKYEKYDKRKIEILKIIDKLSAAYSDKLLVRLPSAIKDNIFNLMLNNISEKKPAISQLVDQYSYQQMIEDLFMKKYPHLGTEKELLSQLIVDRFSKLYHDQSGTLVKNIREKISNLTPISILNSIYSDSMLELLDLLFNKKISVFINIGRYDYQKGHDRLIKAFDKMHETYNNTALIIVAPHGPLKEQTISQAASVKSRNSIFILGRMSNPYSLLKLCNAFVLSSLYEGLGLVAYEALAVDTDLITVALPPTIQYLKGDEAMVVENSEEGLYDGLMDYMRNRPSFTKFDFTQPRKQSAEDFEKLFSN